MTYNYTFDFMKLVKYKISELELMKSSLIKSRELLAENLLKIDSAIEFIENSVKITFSNSDTEIVVPENLLEINYENNTNSAIKWKEETLELINFSSGFLSTNAIYLKLKTKYPLELSEKRKSIKTISSTLLALVNEMKIGRVTDDSGVFIFGSIDSDKHFQPNGSPNQLYIEKKQL